MCDFAGSSFSIFTLSAALLIDIIFFFMRDNQLLLFMQLGFMSPTVWFFQPSFNHLCIHFNDKNEGRWLISYNSNNEDVSVITDAIINMVKYQW